MSAPTSVPAFEFGVDIAAGVAAGVQILQLRNISRNNNAVITPAGTPFSLIGLTLLEIVLADATVTDLGFGKVSGAAGSDGTYDPAGTTFGTWVNRQVPIASLGPWDPRAQLAIASLWTGAPAFSAPPDDVAKWDRIAVNGNRVIWEWPEENPLVILYDDDQSWCVQNFGAGAAGAMHISGRFLVYPAAGTNP